MCHGCRMPITDLDKESKEYIRGVACPNCFNSKTKEQKARYMSRQKQVDLAKKRNHVHFLVRTCHMLQLNHLLSSML